ncbi:MAG: heparan-alpha-glucosaminide N-acetyltransferase domain-containing protein [Halobacteriovoraceae bacterium]|nr:heparan-alpha-glucosaminide N-acetyltransferase domain-containing protein [Halobacteriovoraceae bacterium]
MQDIHKPYLNLLDLVRLMAMLAIVTFHSTEFVFFSNNIQIQNSTYLYKILHEYARLVPYSGHYIILLSFFLIGYTGKVYKNLSRWVMLFLSAHVMVMIAFHEGPFSTYKMEWDIYPFLAVSFLLLAFLQRINFKRWELLLLFSTLVLMVPIDVLNIPKSFPLLKMVFLGHCEGQSLGAWPLFPWLALPLFSLSLGKLSFEKLNFLKSMNFKELSLWSIGLGLSLAGFFKFHMPMKDSFPIGGGFYCFILRRSVLEFWSSFFPLLFLIRLSFLVKAEFGLRKLSWNNNFAFTYIIHLGFLSLGVLGESLFLKMPLLFDLFIIIVIVGSEVLGRKTVKYANLR